METLHRKVGATPLNVGGVMFIIYAYKRDEEWIIEKDYLLGKISTNNLEERIEGWKQSMENIRSSKIIILEPAITTEVAS